MDMLTGHGKPTRNAKGLKGQFYKDLDTGDIYECELSSEFSTLHHSPVGGYLWKLRVDGNGDDVVKDGGVVRSVNGVLPDGNGEIKCHHSKVVSITDGTAISPTILQYVGINKMSEIVGWLRNPGTYDVVFLRDIRDTAGKSIGQMRSTGFNTYKTADGNWNAIVYFGNDLCPLILDSAANTLSLDPDWVAPTSGGGSTTYEVLESRLRHYTVGSVPGEPVTMEEFKVAVANGAIYVIDHNDARALIMGYTWTGDGKTWGGVEAFYFASNGSKQTAYTAEVDIAV